MTEEPTNEVELLAHVPPADMERAEMLAEIKRRNDLKDDENRLRRSSNFLQKVVVTLLCILFVAGSACAWYAYGRLETLINDQEARSGVNRELLEVIEAQTSPEALAERDKQLANIIAIVDCDNEQNLQAFIDNLAEQGIVNPFDILDACDDPPIAGGG